MLHWVKKNWWVLLIIVVAFTLIAGSIGAWSSNKAQVVAGFWQPVTLAFQKINAPAGTDPTANSQTDTLNLTSSDSSVTITGNSTSKTIDTVVNSKFLTTSSSFAGAITGNSSTTVLAPIDRYIEILGASLTGNSTNGFTAAADVTFGTITLTVPQFDTAAEDYGNFQFELPLGFGTGGTTTVTTHFDFINHAASSGTAVGGLKLATTIAGIPGATAKEATGTWAVNDECYKSAETSAITIAGSPAAGTHVYGQFYVKSTSTVNEDPYILTIVVTFKGN